MSKELVISSNRHETKVAILEEDQLVEIYFQRSNEYSLAGSIHKGRVTRVLPGMQSAFVDLGLERDTFLYVSDFFEESEEYDRIPSGPEVRGSRGEDRSSRADRGERPDRAERPERAERQERADRGERPLVEIRQANAPLEAATLPPDSSLADTAEGLAGPSPSGQRANEERDQRGRRSRRRRNRGRGFPDSKYASDSDSGSGRGPDFDRAPDASGNDASRTLEEAVPQGTAGSSTVSIPETGLVDYEFPVLPGESLAKYRHPHANPIEDKPAPGVEKFEPQSYTAGGAAPAREAADVISEPPAAQIEEQAEEQPEELEPEAAAVSQIIAESREGSFTLEEVADSQQPSAALLETSVSEAFSNDQVEVNEPQDLFAAPEGRDAEAAPGQLSANVREQGGRYMHRMPRRMRRKMRGDGRPGPEGRSGPAGPIENGRAAEPNPAPAVRQEEPRTVARPDKAATTPSIADLLKEGQEILVQIAKEPLGQKGARITSHIALPGRYVVYMPTLEHMGVSRKVGSDEERLRLKRILQTHSAGMTGGFIVRTAGEGTPEDEIAADMSFLFNLWVDIRQKAEKRPAPLLLHHDLDIVQRILRDQFTDTFKAIWVDNEELYESVLRFVQRFHPPLVGRVKLYTRSAPIFDAFNVTPELEKALRPKVWLKSGGYIVINQTEALVAIDVNTGKYVGKSNRLEDTIVKTNTEAVKEIVRQIRLRDLGGIIVVDFIDMDERKNRQKVMQTLEEAMRADKAPNKILQFNDFGLVAITRKRVKQSLERALCSPCPYCEGAGYVKSVQTTVNDILQEAHKIGPALEGKDVILRVHPDLAKFLKSHQNRYLEEMEETLRRPVLVKADPSLHHEKFDLA